MAGAWSIELHKRELRDPSGQHVELRRRSLELLFYLAQHHDRVISKDELISENWKGLAVTDDSVVKCISDIRQALGPGLRDTIRTVSGRGYMLSGWRSDPSGPRLTFDDADEAPPPRTANGPVLPSLAVLPFENMSGEIEQDYFADGVVEDIITALSKFRSFAVIARNSSFIYKGRTVDVRQVARELGVRYVLSGSVRRAGNRLRITGQLVDGVTGAQLWAQHFDGAVDDVFEFQDRITENVVGIVEPHVQQAELERSRRERPHSLAGYDLYLRALPKFMVMSARDSEEASALIESALTLEPDNATYLALALNLLHLRFVFNRPSLRPDDRERGLDYANRALVNGSADATVLAQAGSALLEQFGDYDRGLAIVRRAAEVNPNNFFVLAKAGVGELHCGDLDTALSLFHRAARLNPAADAFFPLTGVAHVHLARGDYEQAVVWAGKSLALNPGYDCAYWMMAAGNAHLGRLDLARHYCRQLMALSPGTTITGIRAGQPAKFPGRIEAVLEGLRLAGMS